MLVLQVKSKKLVQSLSTTTFTIAIPQEEEYEEKIKSIGTTYISYEPYSTSAKKAHIIGKVKS